MPAGHASAATTYTIRPLISEHGSLTPGNTQTVTAGSSLYIAITPEAGYHIQDVRIDGISVGYLYTGYNFTNIQDNHTIEVTFAASLYQFTIDYPYNGGVLTSPQQKTYDYNQTVTFTATPTAGYHFDHWTGDITGTTNPMTIQVTRNLCFGAIFTPSTYYKLTILPADHMTIAVISGANDLGTYAPGRWATLFATVDAGYSFGSWCGDAASSCTGVSVFMNSDKTVTASALSNSSGSYYTVAVSSSPAAGGTVTKSPDYSTYVSGTTVALTATPAAGYHFLKWTGDVATINGKTVVIANGNRTATAIFEADASTYVLTTSINVPDMGHITRSPDAADYLPGTVVTLTATPLDGHCFIYWMGDIHSESLTTTVTMNGNKSVVAVFDTLGTYYTLNTILSPAGGGSVTRDLFAKTYAPGTSVTVTAIPAQGYTFSGWSGDLSDKTNPATIVMNANKTITATFAPLAPATTYTLDASVNDRLLGTVTKSPNTATYAPGTVVTLTATAVPQSSFVYWLFDAHGENSTTTITMDGNKKAMAVFSTPLTPIITNYTLFTAANVKEYGNVTVSPAAASYASGTVVTVTAKANSGYHFVRWEGDITGTSDTTTVTMNANKNITAVFATNFVPPYVHNPILVVNVSPVNSSRVDTSYSGEGIMTANLTAVASPGFHFVQWSGDASGTNIETSVVVDTDKTVLASFAKDIVQHYQLTIVVQPLNCGKIAIDRLSKGDEVVLTALPNPGFHFLYWSTDVAGTSATITITLDANKTATANFGPDVLTVTKYDLTVHVSLEAAGMVIRTPNSISYDTGTSVSLTAVASDGYRFVCWTGDISSKSDQIMIEMNGDKTVTAVFLPEKTHVVQLTVDKKNLLVDQEPVIIDVAPVIVRSTTYVPVSAFLQQLGGTVKWNPVTYNVSISLDGKTIDLWINRTIAKINGQTVRISKTDTNVAPIIINGRTMVPLRFIGEAFGATVEWNAKERTVTLTYEFH